VRIAVKKRKRGMKKRQALGEGEEKGRGGPRILWERKKNKVLGEKKGFTLNQEKKKGGGGPPTTTGEGERTTKVTLTKKKKKKEK